MDPTYHVHAGACRPAYLLQYSTGTVHARCVTSYISRSSPARRFGLHDGLGMVTQGAQV